MSGWVSHFWCFCGSGAARPVSVSPWPNLLSGLFQTLFLSSSLSCLCAAQSYGRGYIGCAPAGGCHPFLWVALVVAVLCLPCAPLHPINVGMCRLLTLDARLCFSVAAATGPFSWRPCLLCAGLLSVASSFPWQGLGPALSLFFFSLLPVLWWSLVWAYMPAVGCLPCWGGWLFWFLGAVGPVRVCCCCGLSQLPGLLLAVVYGWPRFSLCLVSRPPVQENAILSNWFPCRALPLA